MEGKNHMNISIDAEKAMEKIQHPFMIKTLNKVGIEGMYLSIIKTIYDKLTANIILDSEKLKPSKIRKKTRKTTLTIFMQHSIGIPSQSNLVKKEIKDIQIKKEKVKLSLFADGMILYIINPKDSIKKLLE